MPAFPEIKTIAYEGPKSKNPLAFRHYNADEMVEGKSMRDHFRFSVVYWHTFRGTGSDPFGPGTMQRPWEDGSRHRRERQQPRARGLRVHREARRAVLLLSRPRRRARRARRSPRRNKNLDAVVKVLKEEQQRTGIKLLWGTANLFSNPRYMHGAATSCNADAFAYRRRAGEEGLEVTKELGGANYVFWGGREGYQNLLEHRHEARARPPGPLHAHGRRLRQGDRLHRPVPVSSPSPRSRPSTSTTSTPPPASTSCGPTAWTTHLKLNIETNHATLAGHTMQHELEYAGMQGFLGSIDANTGDLLLGWDTDQFPTDIYLTTQCMLALLKYGGLTPGGVNFDAKVRRESFEPVDLFHAHIGGMDAFARGLKIAAAIRADGELDEVRQGALQQSGTAASAPRSKPASTASSRSKSTCSKKGEISPQHAAAGRRCSRT